MILFRNRQDAGRQLASRLQHLQGESPLVLALPRGGVPVAEAIADALGAPLDVIISVKLGAPGREELGFGAISEGGARFVDPETVRLLGLGEEAIEEAVASATAKMERRVARYREGRQLPGLQGRTVILVDDGIATGGTARAAIQAVRSQSPAYLALAVPVAAAQTFRELRQEVDEAVCVEAPLNLWAIGAWYEDFGQLEDEQVLGPLRRLSSGEEAAPL